MTQQNLSAWVAKSGPDVKEANPPFAVVLLHAFPLTADMWSQQFEHLLPRAGRGELILVVPDFSGFGESAARAPQSTMAGAADEIATLLDELKITNAVICGVSMGGYVAFELVRRYPALVCGLLLSNTRADPDTDDGRRTRAAQIAVVSSQGLGGIAKAATEKLLGAKTRATQPELTKAVEEMVKSCPQTTYAEIQRALGNRADARPWLKSIQIPTAVIAGSEDGISGPAQALEMKESIPGATLTTIQGAGHLAPLEAPAEWNRALDALLVRVSDTLTSRRKTKQR